MIKFQQRDPQDPSKESEVVLDLMPLMLFGVGFLAVKALLNAFDV